MTRRKRRIFSTEFKFETVIEALRSEKSAAQICRERDIIDMTMSTRIFCRAGSRRSWSTDPRSSRGRTKDATKASNGSPNWSSWWGGRRWKSRF